MLSLPLLLGTTFYHFPNDAVIGFIFVLAMLLGVVIIRTHYILMHRRHHYPDDEVHLGVLGGRTIRGLALAMALCMVLLGFRVEMGNRPGLFWTLDSLTRGWWCIIRIAIAGLAALCATVFESHWAFRAWSSVTVPLASILDLLSEANFAVKLSCLDHGLCQPDDALSRELYLLAWRDIVSAVLTLVYTGVSTWLWFIHGIWRNDLPLPRLEHRVMSAQLDKIKLKPKELKRRQTEEQSNLEKMLGYN